MTRQLKTNVSLGETHSSALTTSGRLFMWGFNLFGQLGDGTRKDRYTPMEITKQFYLGNGDKLIHVSLGDFHSSALTESGRLFMWGYNDWGQIGDGYIYNKHTPTPREVTHQFDKKVYDKIIAVSLGNTHSSALTTSGRLFMWGHNLYGRLGNGTDKNRDTPMEITHQFDKNFYDKIIAVSLGGFHSSALTGSGRLFMWGRNEDGQLGDGRMKDIDTPVEITDKLNS